MANITTKLNLLAIPGAVKHELEGKNGKKVKAVVIPIEYANLFEGEKGVYLDLIGFDIKNHREGSKDTHLVKQSLPKEKQTDDMPILGSHIVWGSRVEKTDNVVQDAVVIDDDSDLPF